jgi:chemotaxis protein histidine kinase CheA
MFIVYQLVTQNLFGSIKCFSKLGVGTHIEILMPQTQMISNAPPKEN